MERLVAERTAALSEAYEDLQGTSALLKASNEELEKFATSRRTTSRSRSEDSGVRRPAAETVPRAPRRHRGATTSTGCSTRRPDAAADRGPAPVLPRDHEAAGVRDVPLGDVLAHVLDDLQNQVERTGGRVEVGPLPTVTADAVQMQQLFQNLVGNALKFAKPGVPPVVTVTAAETEAGWRITVADNGIGFEPQYADKIFELFQRLHGRMQFEGTGLDLL